MKRDRGTQIQYFKLMLLTFVHLLADCTSNSLPGFLPAAMTYFGLDLAYGVVFVSTMGICCNLLQVPASKLGSRSPSSFWIKTGLLMLCSGSLMGFLPSQIPFAVICLVVMISAIGIAIVHPAGLRGVQALHHVSPGLATSVFMTGGFLGGALSPWIAGLLVERFGLKGLALFVPLTFLVTILIHVSRIRLVTESSGSDPRKKELYSPWSFFFASDHCRGHELRIYCVYGFGSVHAECGMRVFFEFRWICPVAVRRGIFPGFDLSGLAFGPA